MLVLPSRTSIRLARLESARSIGSSATNPFVVFRFEGVIPIGDIDTVACQRNTQMHGILSLHLEVGNHRWKPPRRFGNSYLLGSRTRAKFYPAPSSFTPPSFDSFHPFPFFLRLLPLSSLTSPSPPSSPLSFSKLSHYLSGRKRATPSSFLPVSFHSSLLSILPFPRRRRKERFQAATDTWASGYRFFHIPSFY